MYIWEADTYCDACGKAICDRLTAEGKAPADPNDQRSYDSDDYPKHCGDDDDHGSSDTPCHCARHDVCLNSVTLPSGRRIGKLLGTDLTEAGERYVVDQLNNRSPLNSGSQGLTEVEAFWGKEFGQYYESIRKAFEGKGEKA